MIRLSCIMENGEKRAVALRVSEITRVVESSDGCMVYLPLVNRSKTSVGEANFLNCIDSFEEVLQLINEEQASHLARLNKEK